MKNKNIDVKQNELGEFEIHIKGLGKIKETGKLNFQSFIESLLKSKYVTG